jgi:acetolactate synthase I/II/III large subunit
MPHPAVSDILSIIHRVCRFNIDFLPRLPCDVYPERCMMPKLSGGEALIRSLYQEGIRSVFGIPGLGQYEAIDALYMTPEIRYISLRNEQAAGYMADGYARASGEIAATLLVPGPGVLNATAGIATAYAVSSPMLVITGTDHQREGHDDERDPPLLHSLTKWTGRAASVEEIPELVHTAMRHLRSGRRRPVAVEVPQAVLAARAEVTLCDPAQEERPGAAPEPFQQALALMRRAKRPLIWAGGGVHVAGAASLVTALAEAWQSPVVTSRSGKGAISDRHPLSLGYAELRHPPLRRWLEERDLILVVGTSTNFSQIRCNTIQIDIDPAQIRQDEQNLGLVGDAGTVLADLLAHAGSFAAPDGAPVAEVTALNRARFDPAQQLQPQWDLMMAIRTAIPDDAILVADMTQLGYYSRNYYPVYAPRSYLGCSRLWTLGASFPIGLGAKLAQPARAVVSVIGDGGFLYNSQELATAVKYQIPIIIVLFNDNAYGNVLRAQQEEFDGHVLGTQLHNPDFVQLAQSYGVQAARAHGAAELAQALRVAVAAGEPTLIEVPVGPMQRVY